MIGNPAAPNAVRDSDRRDFTLRAFRKMLVSALDAGYAFRPFGDVMREPGTGASVMLRHDVDLRPDHAVRTAELEHGLGIRGTYYFRIVPESFDREAIRRIAALGHEIGYHYEDLTLEHGDRDRALVSFARNLERLRAVAPVTTACMHGSPATRWDNRDMWKGPEDLRAYGLIGEPYLDLDFTRVGYLTDTGRSWDGAAFSVRDKVAHALVPRLRSTTEVAAAFVARRLPPSLMINVHPQRWTDDWIGWTRELLAQTIKNQVKRVIVIRNG